MQGFDGVAARWVSHKTCNCARVTCTAAALGTREIYWARIEARRRAVSSPGRRAAHSASNENKLPNAAACRRGAHSMHLAACSIYECVYYVCIEFVGKSELGREMQY